MSTTEAVNQAVDECITENVLADFLKAHRAEVLDLYLAEVNEEALRHCLRKEGYDEGREDHLTEQITKKIKAGKSLEQIAAEVEETPEAIAELYQKIKASLEIKVQE